MSPFQFQFSFRSVTPLMDYGNTFPLMFGILLMKATQLPRNIMEWMRLTVVLCPQKHTIIKIIVLSVLTHTFLHLWAQNCLFGTICVTCVEEVKFTTRVSCCLLCREGFGVDSGVLWGLLQGRVKLGLESGYLVQK